MHNSVIVVRSLEPGQTQVSFSQSKTRTRVNCSIIDMSANLQKIICEHTVVLPLPKAVKRQYGTGLRYPHVIIAFMVLLFKHVFICCHFIPLCILSFIASVTENVFADCNVLRVNHCYLVGVSLCVLTDLLYVCLKKLNKQLKKQCRQRIALSFKNVL